MTSPSSQKIVPRESQDVAKVSSPRHSALVRERFDLTKEIKLVSWEGKETRVPAREVLSWSDTFLELILTCQPDGRIVLHERHETLEQFKELVQTKNVTWQAESEVPLLDQVLDLAFFLKSYQCKRAMSDLVEIIARRVAGLSALSTPLSGDSSSQPRFPPLILFAVGARVERPDVCEAALNFPKGGWAHYDKWTHPPGLGSDSLKRNTLHLLGIPYKLLAVLPYDYKLALALTPVKKVVRAGSPKDDTPHGSHFIARLRRIQSMRTECDGKKGKRPVIFVELSRSRGRRFKRGE